LKSFKLVVFILIILSLISCNNQKKIIGTWHDKYGYTWVFNNQGILAFGTDEEEYTKRYGIDFEKFNYKIKRNKLFFIIPRDDTVPVILQTYKLSFSPDGKTLNLKEGYKDRYYLWGKIYWLENILFKDSDESDYIQEVLINNYLPQVKEKNTALLEDISYNDKNGNLFYEFDNRKKVTCTLLNKPEFDLLLQLKDNLVALTINTKKITDISFLKNLPQLKELYILDSNISSLESIKYLENLKTLYIASGFPKIIDCSIFRDLDNLKEIDFGNNEVENIGAIYYLAYGWSLDRTKGYRDYCDKYRVLWDSNSYVFHYDKYHVFQNGVKIMEKPAENSGIVAELKLHDEIQIIEYTDKEEKINDVWGYWYKIKHDNVVGYVFGGYIAAKTLITDIDKNGIKDYFYLRYSESRNIEPDKDISIYINDKKIDTSVLSTTERYLERRPYEWGTFEEGDGYVLIRLSQYGREDYEYRHIFKVLPNGKIGD